MAERSVGQAEQVKQLFDAKAATWSAKYTPDGRLAGRLVQFATALAFHVPAGGRVLDLGCGTGELARAAACTGLRVIACDISTEMLSRAVGHDPGHAVEWIRLDPLWRRLPFEAGAFDAVMASSVLEYVDEPAIVLRECARTLRPAGVVLCTVPDLSHPTRWLEWGASVGARLPGVGAAGRRWPYLDRYLTYLQISRRRRPMCGWHAAAERAGLRSIQSSAGTGPRSPLRLLTFQKVQ